MNKLLGLLVVFALVSQLADAAPKKKSKVKKSKTTNTSTTSKRNKKMTPEQIKQANKAAAAAVDVAQKPAPVGLVAKVTPAAPTAITTTQVKQPEVAKAKSGFGLTWLSINGLGMRPFQGIDDGKLVEISSWEQPNIKYKFNENWSVAVMPQFFHTWFGDQQKEQDVGAKSGQLEQGAAFNMGNVALKLTNSNLLKFGDGFKVDGQLRFDLPTSEVAQKNDQVGETWVSTGISKSFGKFDLKGTLIGRIYHQSYNTSRLVDNKDVRLQNKAARHYQYLDVGYNFTEKLNLTLEYGTYVTYSFEDVETNRPQKVSMNRIADIGLSYTFTKNFTLAVGLSEVTSSINDTRMPFDTANTAEGGEAYFVASFNI
ncbi:MAG: hypothetical protein IPM57_01730 [Oligoflexia bacterium]|nr:hypothetical protein [Oligoflexia bacterium]